MLNYRTNITKPLIERIWGDEMHRKLWNLLSYSWLNTLTVGILTITALIIIPMLIMNLSIIFGWGR
jgi:hypothetical protein